ncbi:glycoside hydrolase family 18 protein, partial [Parathielavia appendiculata]
ALFSAPVSSDPFPRQRAQTDPPLPRLILYYQTTHDSIGRPISMLPLINKQRIALTHLIVGAFHVNANNTIHLNDFPPHHPIFHTLWKETRVLQSAGIKIFAIVGGAAPGSFTPSTLDAPDTPTFESSYALLRKVLTAHKLDGIDIDVEEPMTQRGITRLINRLHADFGGRNFTITLAPVATALLPAGGAWGNLSGFDYAALDRQVGRMIGWYNAQFYNGFGTMATTALFDRIVGDGGWDPRRIVVGQLTSPENGGGFVGHERLENTVRVLKGKYGKIGGVVGWEYFNGVPGGLRRPWEWAEVMTGILRPGRRPVLKITREMAQNLNEAWVESAAAAGVGGEMCGLVTAERWTYCDGTTTLVPNVDYLGMVN